MIHNHHPAEYRDIAHTGPKRTDALSDGGTIQEDGGRLGKGCRSFTDSVVIDCPRIDPNFVPQWQVDGDISESTGHIAETVDLGLGIRRYLCRLPELTIYVDIETSRRPPFVPAHPQSKHRSIRSQSQSTTRRKSRLFANPFRTASSDSANFLAATASPSTPSDCLEMALTESDSYRLYPRILVPLFRPSLCPVPPALYRSAVLFPLLLLHKIGQRLHHIRLNARHHLRHIRSKLRHR